MRPAKGRLTHSLTFSGIRFESSWKKRRLRLQLPLIPSFAGPSHQQGRCTVKLRTLAFPIETGENAKPADTKRLDHTRQRQLTF